MANWCWNTVDFKGNEETLKQIKAFFAEMAAKEEQEKQGQLPAFFPERSGYMFNIFCEGYGFGYETKWAPNVEVIKAIADHFKAGFQMNYEELMMQVYGECSYDKGILTDIFLDDEDFSQYDLNEEDGEETWVFEGSVYDSDCEILEILLERKKELFAAQLKINANELPKTNDNE